MTRARELANLGKTGGISVGTSAPGSTGGYLVGVGLSAGGVPTRQLDVASGDCVVGSGITFGGNSGIVSATAFHGDGSNLSGTDPAGINTAGFSTFTSVAASGIVTVTNTTASTNATTGALVVSGGVGVSKKLNVGDTTDSTSTTTGSVVISGGVGIGKSLFVGGQLSVGGTITYDDVTNVDSVGLITAQSGVKVTGGDIAVGSGVTVGSDLIHLTDNSKINLGIASDFQIYHDGTHNYFKGSTSADTKIIQNGNFLVESSAGETILRGQQNAGCDLWYNDTKRIETISTGASVYGGLRLEGGGFTREHLNIVGTALNSNKVINLSDGMVHYRSAAVGAANVKLNIISNAGVNTDMAIGDIMAVTVITVAGNTAHFVDQIRIDGVEASAGVTTNWSGGSVPEAGGGSGIDSYAFNVMKTGNATYVVLANQTLTSS